MFIYLLMLVLIILISLKNPYKLTVLDKLFFLFLAIVSGLRYEVGTDFLGYVDYYNLIANGVSTPAEVSFVLISKFLSEFGLGSQSVFMIFSILTMFFIYLGLKYFIKENYIFKPVFYIILIIFTYFPSLNGVRQALAAAILFYASKYIVEKDLKKFIVWVLIAMSFHMSSVFYLIFYFFARKSYKKMTLLVLLVTSFLISTLGYINSFLEFSYLNLSFLDIGGYLENYLYHSYNSREIEFGIVFFINSLVLLLFIFLKDKLVTTQKSLVAFNLFYMFILVGIWSMDASMLSRLTYFFSIFMAICISRFGLIFDEKSRKIIEYLLISLYVLLYIFLILNGYLNPGQADYIPYNFNIDFFK